VGRRVVALGALVAALAVAAEARADDASTFAAGQSAYDAGQYAQAEILFRKMLDPRNPPCASGAPSDTCRVGGEYVEQARALMAAALVVLKRPEEADVLFEQILLANPTWEPNQAIYPISAQQRVIEVRRRIKPKLDDILKDQQKRDLKSAEAMRKARQEYDEYIQKLERMASQRQMVASNSRVIAAIPFGVGQLQNRDKSLFWTFLISEVATGGAAVVSGIIGNYYGSVDPRTPGVNNPALQAKLDAALITNRITFSVWATITGIGVIQAEAAFVAFPVQTAPQPRQLPPAPKVDIKVEPIVSAIPHGAFVGVGGTF
jgi:tetratricopeptide (TPR) repeat protein